MAIDSQSSTIGHHIKCQIPRKPTSTTTTTTTTTTTDPNPQHIPSIIQSTRCKSTISSLLLSTFTTTHNSNKPPKSFKNSALRGFGCRAQPEVTVPAVIRSSAHWEDNREKKNTKKKKKKKKKLLVSGLRDESSVVVGVHDLWCGPGIADFVADPAADSVVSSRPVSGRGKIDLNRAHHNHRERAGYNSRRRVNTEHFVSADMDSDFEAPHFGLDVFDDYHNLRNRSSEIMMFQSGLLMGRRSGGPDRYWDWRLDVDNMTYEELLELGERIGYVSTGLREEQISRCIQKTKLSVEDERSSDSLNLVEVKGKCSICQEEYEAEDVVGSLICGHDYHLNCIKQWLAQKKVCAVCKVEVSSQ